MIKRLKDKVWRLSNLYKIQNKEKQTIVFRNNFFQQQIEKHLQKIKKSGKPFRVIILKPRQIGITTFFAIKAFDNAYWKKNQFAAIIAHKKEKADEIFQIPRFAYKNLPLKLYFKAHHDSVRQLKWEETHSQVKVTTDGHGITPNWLHLTEVAWMKNPKEMITEALQGVPLLSGQVIMESTANGIGGYFHSVWTEAVDNPESLWHPIFLKWWDCPDYCLPVSPNFELTREEEKLLEKYKKEGLKKGHLNFRRLKIREAGKGQDEVTGLTGELSFKQNYPFDSVEAFIVPTGSFFNIASLNSMLFNVSEELKKEQIGRGYLRIFTPRRDVSYIISVDTSFGAGTDYTAAIVLEKETRVIAATFRGKYGSVEFTKHLLKLGVFYNNALLVIERNMGHAVLNEIIYHSDYKNLYYHSEYDQFRNCVRKPGFPTTSTTRNIALSKLEDAISNREFEIPDRVFIRECINFGYRNGKLQAMTGNDDCVISLAIGNYLCQQSKRSLEPPINIMKPMGI